MSAIDAELRELLTRARTIAIVGLSDKPDRDSHDVGRYLQSQGYRIVPVNPTIPEVLGEISFASVGAIPVEIRIDILDIFRRSDRVPPIVAEGLERGVGAVWMQLGVENAEAARWAEAKGVPVYQNVCLMQQHRRLRIPPVPRS